MLVRSLFGYFNSTQPNSSHLEKLPLELHVHILFYLLYTSPISLGRMACVSRSMRLAVNTLHLGIIKPDACSQIDIRGAGHFFWHNPSQRKLLHMGVDRLGAFYAKRKRRQLEMKKAIQAMETFLRDNQEHPDLVIPEQIDYLKTPFIIGQIALRKLTISDALSQSTPNNFSHLSDGMKNAAYKLGLSAHQIQSIETDTLLAYHPRYEPWLSFLSHFLLLLLEKNIPIAKVNERILSCMAGGDLNAHLDSWQILFEKDVDFNRVINLHARTMLYITLNPFFLQLVLLEIDIDFSAIEQFQDLAVSLAARLINNKNFIAQQNWLIQAIRDDKSLGALNKISESIFGCRECNLDVLAKACVPLKCLIELDNVVYYKNKELVGVNRLQELLRPGNTFPLHSLLIIKNIPFCKIADLVTANPKVDLRSPWALRQLSTPAISSDPSSKETPLSYSSLHQEVSLFKEPKAAFTWFFNANQAVAQSASIEAEKKKFIFHLKQLFDKKASCEEILTFVRAQQNQHPCLVEAKSSTAPLIERIKKFCMAELHITPISHTSMMVAAAIADVIGARPAP